MTVCLATSTRRYNGADGEQLSITDATEGSRFIAVDTGKRYVYHDGGWTEDLTLIYALQNA